MNWLLFYKKIASSVKQQAQTDGLSATYYNRGSEIKSLKLQGKGDYAGVLSLAVQYEAGNWNKVDEMVQSLGISGKTLPVNYLAPFSGPMP